MAKHRQTLEPLHAAVRRGDAIDTIFADYAIIEVGSPRETIVLTGARHREWVKLRRRAVTAVKRKAPKKAARRKAGRAKPRKNSAVSWYAAAVKRQGGKQVARHKRAAGTLAKKAKPIAKKVDKARRAGQRLTPARLIGGKRGERLAREMTERAVPGSGFMFDIAGVSENPRRRNSRKRNSREYRDPDTFSEEDVLTEEPWIVDDDGFYVGTSKRPSVTKARREFERDAEWAWTREYELAPKLPKVPRGSRIQALIFDSSKFTPRTAHQWAIAHGFAMSTPDIQAKTIRLRQLDPRAWKVVGTITLRPGVKATVAREK